MRSLLCALPLLLGTLASVQAAVGIGVGIGLPNVSIGVNFPVYPRMVPVPGYPVYYDPHASANYFFYDGLYWVYRDDNWYRSSWYNGPWQSAAPDIVPVYVLRVPVRYYRRPPIYFRGWAPTRSPRWGEHWGRDWEVRRAGWDRWDRRQHVAAAPLPAYQREYSGARYPREAEQQHVIRGDRYRYQPNEAVAKQTFEQRGRPDSVTASHGDKPMKHAPAPANAKAHRDAQAAPGQTQHRRDPPNDAQPRDKGQPAQDARQEAVTARHEKRHEDKAAAQAERHRTREEERSK
jgi:hypothetical protein